MLFERIEPNFVFNDERGSLVQLVREGYKQFNFITSKKGVVRGGHYHDQNEEAFFVISGSFEFTAQLEDKTETEVFKAGDFFKVSSGIKHSFKYLEDTTLISMYTNGVELENGEKDILE